ncbi:serine/threonine-protein kinase [Rhodococcus sp. IEGM 1379]|uniref:serine/threonine-protein kinase n=1 Tax=Rhodococcus sp. IEGM 1379 TaxID=3047086 RepID=UPI0024B70077|nr:serine/threonine-protein kinase [Rhodococcus sp. IEGM 1379]MDI9914253.1 serine/threonine-protein kinase [Rhodococcus sp. IEGM 1379]
MNALRPQPSPPRIPGYEYVEMLGSGGFSDVFLYQEHATRRRVAVKVLLDSTMKSVARRTFENEAQLMGQLSSHPAIVPVFNTGHAPDGRPYLVMEYCPLPNFGARFRTERLPVADVLRVGIEIAGAVETAHRGGILHRDIKPANILVTAYRRAVLTDFGIAGMRGAEGDALSGLSVPWAPPEFFEENPHGEVPSDVWGLAATLYSMLAGRAPFEIPGGDNSAHAQAARISSIALPRTGRQDVPASFENVLATAMAKIPQQRYPSALDLARGLQTVQAELQLPVTSVDLVEAVAPNERVITEAEDGDGTRFSVRSIDPTGGGQNRAAWASAPALPVERVFETPAPVRAPTAEELTSTRARLDIATPIPAPESAAPTRKWPLALAGVIVVVGAAAVGGVVVFGGGPDSDVPESLAPTLPSAAPAAASGGRVPAVTDVVGVVNGDTATFTWVYPDPQVGDSFRWTRTRTGRDESVQQSSASSVAVPVSSGPSTCIEVTVVRESGRASAIATEGCAT